MKMNRNVLSILAVLLVFCLSLTTAGWAGENLSPLFAAEQKKDQKIGLAGKVDQTLEKIGELLQHQARRFAEHLNKGKQLSLEIKGSFYDRNLRRVFIEFRGTGVFSGKLTSHIPLKDHCLTSDGSIAYDLTIERVSSKSNGVNFEYRGDLVISLDKVLYDFVKETTTVAGAIVLGNLADSLLVFVQNANYEVLAKAVTHAFAKFSRESLAVSGAELMQNASQLNNKKVSNLIQGAIKSGGMPTFIVFTIIKASGTTVAGMAGGSLGTIVGNLIVPGVGGAVGAFLGSKIASTIAKTVVYELTVEIPIEFALKRIVKNQQILALTPGNEFARAKIESSHELIFKKVKRETDNEEYKTFNQILKKIDDFDAGERKCFIPLLQKFQELLRFKLMEEKDWYCSKKLLQMKQKIQEWGLQQAFSF